MTTGSCFSNEEYGVLRELEDKIVLQQRDDWTWGYDGPDTIVQTLFATAFLTSMKPDTARQHADSLLDTTKLAEDSAANSSEMFLAFSLGLASCTLLGSLSVRSASSRLLAKVSDGFDRLSLRHRVALLLGCALFYNLLDVHSRDQVPNLHDYVVAKVAELSQYFADDRFQEDRTRLLYVMSSFPGCETGLQKLYTEYRGHVEKLRDFLARDDERILLLKPYSLLGIACHRTMIEEIVSRLRTSNYDSVQKRLMHRLSLYFTYEGKVDCGISLIDGSEEGTDALRIIIGNQDRSTLAQLRATASYVAMIGVGLVTSGYLKVYVIPESERQEYLSFVASKDNQKYIVVQQQKAVNQSRTWAQMKYNWELCIQLAVLLTALALAYPMYVLMQLGITLVPAPEGLSQFIVLGVTASPFLVYLVYQVYTGVTRHISGEGKNIVTYVLRRKRIKEDSSQEFLDSLGP